MTATHPGRLLHIVGDSKSGGVTQVVFAIATAAASAGWEVDILTTDDSFAKRLADTPINIIRLDVIRAGATPWGDVFGVLRLAGFLRSRRYDLVHTHRTKSGILGRIAASIARVPVVIHTVHGYPFSENDNSLTRKLVSRLERLVGVFTDDVVAVSHYHAHDLTKDRIVPKRKLTTITNGIPDPLGSHAQSVERTAESSVFRLLYVGRLAEQKGLRFLIHAMAELQHGGTETVHLSIVGEGPLGGALRRQADGLGLIDSITFEGFRTDTTERTLKADLVVLPSLWEGLSIALLEAMACGKPIVTTSIPSNVEVTDGGKGAFLVPPEDSNALCCAIETLLESPTLATDFGQAGRAIFLERYTEDQMSAKYVALYEQARVVHTRRYPA